MQGDMHIHCTVSNGIFEKEGNKMAEEKMSGDAKRAMWSQFLGFGMDAYDMAMVVVLAPVLSKIFASKNIPEAWQFLAVAFLYAVTMAARPVGAAFFGHYADKIGRRFLLVLTIAGVGVASVACAFIPTPDQVGLVWAYSIFMFIRFIMGCFFGGEYAVGHTFAIEHAPAHIRGKIGGFVQSGFPLGYAIASFVVLGTSYLIGEQAMSDYGWRIMFFTGIAPVGLALYIRRKLVESPVFTESKAKGHVDKAPFLALFKRPQLWVFLQVFAFMTGLFFTDYAIYQFIPQILKGPDKFNLVQYTFIYGVALFCAFIGYNVYGRLADMWGRKRLTMWYCLIITVCAIPLYQVLIKASLAKSITIAVVAAIMAGMLKLAWGVIPAYLSERFPTKTRAVGVGFGYSAGALVGGAGVTPLVGLFHMIPAIAAIEGPKELWLSASCVLTLGAIITFLSLLWSPETKDINLSTGEDTGPKKRASKEPAVAVAGSGK
jgi:MHS family proline/betaine transporter-like MFS transporter